MDIIKGILFIIGLLVLAYGMPILQGPAMVALIVTLLGAAFLLTIDKDLKNK